MSLIVINKFARFQTVTEYFDFDSDWWKKDVLFRVFCETTQLPLTISSKSKASRHRFAATYRVSLSTAAPTALLLCIWFTSLWMCPMPSSKIPKSKLLPSPSMSFWPMNSQNLLTFSSTIGKNLRLIRLRYRKSFRRVYRARLRDYSDLILMRSRRCHPKSQNLNRSLELSWLSSVSRSWKTLRKMRHVWVIFKKCTHFLFVTIQFLFWRI